MPLNFGCFVTGTDTEVGKTLVSAALLHKCREHGWSTLGMKPVAAGCTQGGNGVWSNEDVDMLTAASSVQAERTLVNPYLFHEAISPHLAAGKAGVTIDPEAIMGCFRRLREQADAIVVEGAGGFLVPLGESFDGGQLARMLGLPLVLVVGMRLGCINHALLTQEAIAARGLKLAGWVANHIDADMGCLEENLATLRERLRAPLLGVLPFMADPMPVAAAGYLSLPSEISVEFGSNANRQEQPAVK